MGRRSKRITPAAAIAALLLFLSMAIVPPLYAADIAKPARNASTARLTNSVAADNTSIPDTAKLAVILSDFEAYAVKSMADWNVPGMAIAIVRGDDVIYEKAFGVRQMGMPDPVTTDTIFQIGSTSKAFTAALVATLVDEGKVAWDDKVVRHLPGFKLYDPWVTREFMITDLMAQRSGMPAHAADGLVMTGSGRDRVIDALRYIKPITSFRSAYAYQNNLWLVAAQLIEAKTGKSWEDNLRERIFKPLGMLSSSSDAQAFTSSANAASLHHDVDGRIVVLPMDWPYIDWVYTYGPAGGINSNIKDVSKWVRMQISDGSFGSKKVVKPESVRFMHAPETPIAGSSDPDQYYCLGWVHREASPYPITWHNGGTSGSKTMIALVPQTRLGIVILSNLVETTMPEALAWRFYDSYFGNPSRDWSQEGIEAMKKASDQAKADQPARPAAPSPALALERYAGSYKNDIFGSVAIRKEGGALTLLIGPKKVRVSLDHWDGNVFKASWAYYGVPEAAGFVTFKADPLGLVEGMTVDIINEDGNGTFVKDVAKAPGRKAPSRERLVIADMEVVRESLAPGPEASVLDSVPTESEFDRLFKKTVPVNGVRNITYEEFIRLRKSPETFYLVDVLSTDDYGTGHIPGAISFPLKTINFYNSVNKIPAGSNLVVYCLDFNCPSSTEAAKKLKGYGYRVLDYKGGLDEWQQKGNSLVR